MLFAVPGERYRLEVSGPLGMQLASLLWKPDGWLALAYPRDEAFRGTGDTVRIPGIVMPPLSIHQILSPAWGQRPIFSANQSQLRMEDSGDSVRIFENGRWLMTLRIKERKLKPTWGAAVWKLLVPEGWTEK